MQSLCNMKAICFDLDDTLYKEIDFLSSGYRAVAEHVAMTSGLCADEICNSLIEWYMSGENPFRMLADRFRKCSLEDCLDIYRNHFPDIHLDEETRNALDALKSEGCLLGLVTDGRRTSQMNKIRALHLAEWMPEELIIINDSPDVFKPSPAGYEAFASKARALAPGEPLDFIYVGDNTAKDFLYPNRRGWKTVCLLDDGRNIHKQSFDLAPEYRPQTIIHSLEELKTSSFELK